MKVFKLQRIRSTDRKPNNNVSSQRKIQQVHRIIAIKL